MKKAIIIGAGPAGLTCAYQLLQETDIKPIILEASNVIGGISATICHNGNRLDLGGHRFFTKNKEVMQLWTSLMPIQGEPAIDDKLLGHKKAFVAGGPNPETDDAVMLIRNRLSRILYLRHFFDYPISLKFQTIKNMGLLRTFKAGLGYFLASVFKRKENSLEDFFINRFGKPLYEMFFEDYTEKLWGIHPRQIAPSWGSQRVKGLSLLKVVLDVVKKVLRIKTHTETSLIDEFFYPKRGSGQFYELMAQKIISAGGELKLQQEVTKINKVADKIISVETKDGSVFTGDYFISSMPIKDLAQGLSAGGEVLEVASELPYRDFITVGVLVNELKIKNQTTLKTLQNIIPDNWVYIQERDVKLGRFQIANNLSPYMVKDILHTVFLGLDYFCTEGDKLWNMSDSDFIEFAIDELVKLGVIERAAVLDSVRVKVKKAYPAYFGSYTKFNVVQEYLDSFSNLYCIGRNGQHRYNNMDHSMLTAIETVNVIKNGIQDKSSIWNVNTEEEYHEKSKVTC
jgi:protoporphyrinogen oxidase